MIATGERRFSRRGPGLGLLAVGLVVLSFGARVRADVETVESGGKTFRVYRIDPSTETIRLEWKGADGKPYRTFRALEAALNTEGKRLRVAMNAGIYEPGFVPSGLHIQNGKTLVPLNLKDGDGNFFLKPNGVFFIDVDGKAGVMEARAYGAAGKKPRLAVQSGPVLLVDGRIHPAFNEGSPNLRYRNGIGVDSQGRIVLVNSEMSEGNQTNFHNFAQLFLRKLDCRSALFLDGDIGQLYVRAADGEVPVEENWFAAMLVVTEAVAPKEPEARE